MKLIVFAISVLFSIPAAAQLTSFDPLYERITEDLKKGKPLIVVSNYGMWNVRAKQPDRNLNWGVYYGHATMMKRARKDRHISKLYRHHDFKKVFESSQDNDPVRTLVYETTIEPNERWKSRGVIKPFTMFLVMRAFVDQEAAALDVTRRARQQAGEKITTDSGTALDTSKAQVFGYFGHNFFYDYADFEWNGLQRVEGRIEKPTGVFAVGCNTARVPGFDAWFEDNAVPLLFSRSLMASEGYTTLSLLDSLASHRNGKEMVVHADKTYGYFQKLGKPNRRVGKPFVSVEYRFKK